MPFWQDLLGYIKQVVLLKEQTDKNTKDIEELREELKKLTKSFTDFQYEVRLHQQGQNDKQESLLLRLQVQLLQFERRLPSPPQERED